MHWISQKNKSFHSHHTNTYVLYVIFLLFIRFRWFTKCVFVRLWKGNEFIQQSIATKTPAPSEGNRGQYDQVSLVIGVTRSCQSGHRSRSQVSTVYVSPVIGHKVKSVQFMPVRS